MPDINEEIVNMPNVADSLLSLIRGLTTPSVPQRMLPSSVPTTEQVIPASPQSEQENPLVTDQVSVEILESEGGLVIPEETTTNEANISDISNIFDIQVPEKIETPVETFTGGFNLKDENFEDDNEYDITPDKEIKKDIDLEDDGFELDPDAEWTPPNVFAPVVTSPESENSFFLDTSHTSNPTPVPVPVRNADPTKSFTIQDVDLEVVENNPDSALQGYGNQDNVSRTPIVFGETETYEIADQKTSEEAPAAYVPFQAGAAELVGGLDDLKEEPSELPAAEEEFNPEDFLPNFDPSRYLGVQQEQPPVSVSPAPVSSELADTEYNNEYVQEDAPVPVIAFTQGAHSVAQMIKELEDLRAR